MDQLHIGDKSFTLARVPSAGKRPLRAWDAADEYLIDHLLEGAEDRKQVAVIGDSFGALSCGLEAQELVVFNESAAGREAIAANRSRNGLAPIAIHTTLDFTVLDGRPLDVVTIKVPKSNAELEDTLHRLRPHLAPDTQVLGAAMAKHIHNSTVEMFERIIGPTTTSLAKKKARLIFSTINPALDPGVNPWPAKTKVYGRTFITHGGGFSPTKLDPGSQLLLDWMRDDPDASDLLSHDDLAIADLGCGNGLIGLVLRDHVSKLGVNCHVTAVDDSMFAVDAAQQNWAAEESGVSVHHAHRLANVCEPGSLDLVVVNPPFHDGRAVGDDIAWSMFVDAHKALRVGGQLIVVGNRHLAYHAKLKKIFGPTDNVASNAKFVVNRAIRT